MTDKKTTPPRGAAVDLAFQAPEPDAPETAAAYYLCTADAIAVWNTYAATLRRIGEERGRLLDGAYRDIRSNDAALVEVRAEVGSLKARLRLANNGKENAEAMRDAGELHDSLDLLKVGQMQDEIETLKAQLATPGTATRAHQEMVRRGEIAAPAPQSPDPWEMQRFCWNPSGMTPVSGGLWIRHGNVEAARAADQATIADRDAAIVHLRDIYNQASMSCETWSEELAAAQKTIAERDAEIARLEHGLKIAAQNYDRQGRCMERVITKHTAAIAAKEEAEAKLRDMRIELESATTRDEMANQMREEAEAKLREVEKEIEQWKGASGLECGGDPDGVTPDAARVWWAGIESRLVVVTAHVVDAEAAFAVLQEEELRLRECMRIAGLTAFMRDRAPEEVAEHLRDVIKSYDDAVKKAEAALATERDERMKASESFSAAIAKCDEEIDTERKRADDAEADLRESDGIRIRLGAMLDNMGVCGQRFGDGKVCGLTPHGDISHMEMPVDKDFREMKSKRDGERTAREVVEGRCADLMRERDEALAVASGQVSLNLELEERVRVLEVALVSLREPAEQAELSANATAQLLGMAVTEALEVLDTTPPDDPPAEEMKRCTVCKTFVLDPELASTEPERCIDCRDDPAESAEEKCPFAGCDEPTGCRRIHNYEISTESAEEKDDG